jgi:hypothetical protein
MPKFNSRNTIQREIAEHPDITLNEAGGIAFKTTPKVELYKRIMTTFVGEPKYYTSGVSDFAEIVSLIKIVADEDPEFVLKLAAFARNEMNLRSASIMLLAEACSHQGCKPFIRKYTPHIVRRADELTEAMSYYQIKFGDIGNRAPKGSMINSLKRGLADSFHNFNAYQFAKYDREGKVKLADVIRVTHPKPRNKDESLLFKQVRTRTLPIPDTWETFISKNGSTKEAWEEIAPKMPYMAKLRNLRNFMQKKVNMEPILKHITSNTAVRNSKQYPFRFYSAYKELQNDFQATEVLEALQEALEISVENMPTFEGVTFLVADVSGSMDSTISEKSKVTLKEIACLMLAMAHKTCKKSYSGVFANSFATVQVTKFDSIMRILQDLLRINVGGSTNAWTSMQWLLDNKVTVDRIILFTDEQCYDSVSYWGNHSLAQLLKEYKRKVNPHVYTYIVNLAGYSTVQFPKDEPRTALIAGWSERIFNFITLYENLEASAAEAIEHYAPFSAVETEEM